jgi:hypothetical protein
MDFHGAFFSTIGTNRPLPVTPVFIDAGYDQLGHIAANDTLAKPSLLRLSTT